MEVKSKKKTTTLYYGISGLFIGGLLREKVINYCNKETENKYEKE